VRGAFWQPALAGSYAQTPQSVYQKAVPLAIAQNSVQDALQFIESDKAISLGNRLHSPQKGHLPKAALELKELKNEIARIQQQMQINPNGNPSLQTALQQRTLRTQLQEKNHRYEELLSRLERKEALGQHSIAPVSFSLSRFRELAAANLDDRWLALEYYMVENRRLILLVLSPTDLKACTLELSPRFFQAVQACHQNAHGSNPHDLEFLGSILIPPEVEDLLTPETTLLIAPHQQLHGLPWAALGSPPLVERSIPCVVPSLHSLVLLGERGLATDRAKPQNGLLLGISEFNGAHPPLPFVRSEVAALTPFVGPGGRVLLDNDATSAIRACLQTAGAPPPPVRSSIPDWVHVASHFFSDPVSGRMSGLALTNDTLWLDQIHALAPLPPLVTFSGCSSVFSRVYSGDEHVGLPTTCFIAGANTVVGSAWPVPDESSADLMVRFYQNLQAGHRPAFALTLAQRALLRAGAPLSAWAGFACLGEP